MVVIVDGSLNQTVTVIVIPQVQTGESRVGLILSRSKSVAFKERVGNNKREREETNSTFNQGLDNRKMVHVISLSRV